MKRLFFIHLLLTISFFSACTAALRPDLIYPLQNSVLSTNMPTLHWSQVPGEKSEVWIDGIKMAEIDNSQNSFIPFPLSFGEHQWFVLTYCDGKKIESDRWKFSIEDKSISLIPDKAMVLRNNWQVKSSLIVGNNGGQLATSTTQTDDWHKTSLPATVLSALVRNGLYPNPYVGLNNMLIPDMSDSLNIACDLLKYSHIAGQNPWKNPYWFRTEFSLDKTFEGKRILLNFNEINYKAEVWLNGKLVADTATVKGMERQFHFDISDKASPESENVLAVAIYPPDHPGLPSPPPIETFAHPGRNLGADALITRDYTKWDVLGWDWQPAVRDRDMGITEEVYISTENQLEIQDMYIASDLPLPDTTLADIKIAVKLVNHSTKAEKFQLKTTIDDGDEKIVIQQKIELAGETSKVIHLDKKTFPQLQIKNPKLWWPSGYGRQNLYNVTMEVQQGFKSIDTETTSFGIREVSTYIGNNERVYAINGRDIYLKGANWVIDMMLNWNAQRYEEEILFAKAANMNFLRVWGPTGVPPKAFFEAADQYGIMIWQDFLHDHWGTFNNNEDYMPEEKLYEKATINVIKKIRNHPSLFTWCGGNEGVNPRENLIMKKLLPEHDGLDSRYYLKTSTGDGVHGGGPYHTIRPKEYFHHHKITGFSSEIGPSGVPVASSMYKFLPELGKNWKKGYFPIERTWTYHDATCRTGSDDRKFTHYDEIVRKDYGFPDSNGVDGVRDYLDKCQLVNYDVYRASIEAVNQGLWKESSGYALWKFNSSWPSLTWQIFDWYQASHAGFYGTQKAGERVHVQLNRDDNTVSIINGGWQNLKGVTVAAILYNTASLRIWQKEVTASVPDNSAFQTEITVPEGKDLNFLKLSLLDSEGNILSDNFYWLQQDNHFHELQHLPEARLSGELTEKSGKEAKICAVTLKNETDKIAFFLHLSLKNSDTEDEILPSFWSDNYFSLLPGEAKTVIVQSDTDIDENVFVEIEGINIKTIQLK
ncbi:MAG: beta galactosidase jelly roll domain-containing protein [Candidatus Marinimicrobia bacterium]|nr:beta galactosidase jelly roll domain-containing protein [Candidatus Neomarinimicrobiota bacterium]